MTRTEIIELYTATFNRASETDGNAYWAGLNASAATIAQGMLDTTDAATYFGTSLATNQLFVEHIYLNTLNKTVTDDAAGIAYWVDLLDNGTTRGAVVAGLVAAVADYSTSTDAATIVAYNQFTNRVAVSDYTAANLATAPADYATSTSFSSGLTVTDAIGTVTTAKTAVDVVKVDNTAVALALTTGVDTLTGSKANDTFTADILTVGATDSIVDATTTDSDTLNMTINAAVASTFTTTNVENINVTSLGANAIDMTKMTGVNALSTTGSTGTVTVTNAANAGMDLGFAGSSTNTISATYTADSLSGTADKLTVNLSTATGVTATVNAGFETAELTVTGTSSLTDLNAPGVTALTISGTGALTIADAALAGFTGITITDTAAISTGAMTGVKTFVATANTGGIVDADIALTTTGFSDTNTIVGDTAGLSFLTGSGADNVSITDAATSNSSTIKMGAGNDIIKLLNTGTAATYVFGEAGDDTILVADSTTAIGTGDLFDGGTGTDTLVIDEASANTWVLRGIENIILTNSAVTANTISSSDTALNIIAEVGSGAGDTAVNLATLTAGSTVTTRAATATYGTAAISTDQASNVTVGFAATEATSTINLATGMTGALTLAKITNATVTLGAASTMTAAAITLTDTTTDLTINATGAFTTTTGNIVGNTLKNLTVTGTAGVTFDDMTSTALETVSVTAAGALNVGDTALSTTKLSNVSLTATGTTGTLDVTAIGNAAATSLTVTETAALALTNTTIDALDIANITITGASGQVTVGLITAADDIVGTIALTATNGELQVETIDAADEAGTITLTSTAGAIDGNTSMVDVIAGDGVTVNMTAATFIDANGAGAGLIAVLNQGGDITASLAGAAVGIVNYTVNNGTTASSATSHGSVDLNASTLTGGLTSTIVNDELTGVGISTVTLGAALATTVNSVIFQGYAGAVSATGSIGMDTFTDVGTGLDGNNVVVVNSSDIFAGSTGTDTMSYAGHVATAATITAATNEGTANGMAINLSSSTVTFYTGTDTTTTSTAVGISTLAAGKAAQYDSTSTAAVATAKAIVVGGEIDTVSGFESIVGTTLNDYIIAGATTTVDGGAGVDYIVGGAGNNSITGGAGADVLTGGDGDDTFNYLLLADLFTGQASVDTTITGGAGTADTIQVGTNSTAFTIANNDVWTPITGVEKIVFNANDAVTNTVALDVTAYAAGIRTVDMSAVTGATGNTLDVSEFTGTDAITLIGSTGKDIITGGAGGDTLTGSGGVDSFVIGAHTLVAGEIDFANLDSITDLGADDFLTMGGNSAGATPASSIDVATATLDITTGGNATLLAAIQAGITAETGAAKAGYLFTVTNSDSSLAGSAGTYAVFNVASDNTFDSATDFIVKLTGTSALTIAAQFDVA